MTPLGESEVDLAKIAAWAVEAPQRRLIAPPELGELIDDARLGRGGAVDVLADTLIERKIVNVDALAVLDVTIGMNLEGGADEWRDGAARLLIAPGVALERGDLVAFARRMTQREATERWLARQDGFRTSPRDFEGAFQCIVFVSTRGYFRALLAPCPFSQFAHRSRLMVLDDVRWRAAQPQVGTSAFLLYVEDAIPRAPERELVQASDDQLHNAFRTYRLPR